MTTVRASVWDDDEFADAVASTRRMMEKYAVEQVPGAYAKGTRIVKAVKELNDTHEIGAMGIVLGVLPAEIEGEFGYFVEWDDLPDVPVFTRGRKLGLAS